ncbi:MAG: carbohydrate kinase family protein [Clostridia bacterium]|nr:carbohydrate kinase family protein [Clostridia bacterium]
MSIVVFGAVFVDIKGYPMAKYIPGGRNVGRVVQTHGGVARNVAEDIANIELRPVFVSVLDRSGISTDVLDQLRHHKVNTDYIVRTDEGLGTWLAIFDNTGDVIASISKRPDLSAVREVLDAHGDELIANADSVVVEIDMQAGILKRIFDLAERYEKPVYAVVSNMSIALERRDLLQRTACVVCNQQEAEMLFSEDYSGMNPSVLVEQLCVRLPQADIPRIVVTLGSQGAVYASQDGEAGFCPAQRVSVVDTTGAGDAFFAGVAIGLTYHKRIAEACAIGTRLASAVIATRESVCPRFRPEEFGLPAPEDEQP